MRRIRSGCTSESYSVRSEITTSPELTDISAREFLVLALLPFAPLGMGLYPQPFTEVMHSSVNELMRHVAVSKILVVVFAMTLLKCSLYRRTFASPARVFMLAMACFVLIADVFVKDKKRTVTFVLTMIALLGAAVIYGSTRAAADPLHV